MFVDVMKKKKWRVSPSFIYFFKRVHDAKMMLDPSDASLENWPDVITEG